MLISSRVPNKTTAFERASLYRPSRTLRLCLVCLIIGAERGAAAPLTNLGHLPGGTNTFPAAVSADGSAVVGTQRTNVDRAFRWTATTGMVDIGAFPGQDPNYRWRGATGVSADGSVIVGWSETFASPSGTKAFRWTPVGGMVNLGSLPGASDSRAWAVSADGAVVVGNGSAATGYQGSAFRWTQAAGMTALGISGTATAVSADGQVIVGWSQDGPFRWTESGGTETLGLFDDMPTTPTALSTDGSVIVGLPGWRWTAATGMTDLGFGEPLGISGSGSIVVGGSYYWTQAGGLRFIRDVLEQDYGLNTTGWGTLYATGISADGRTIIGYGEGPGPGQYTGWIATIPEPNSLALITTGLGLFVLKRNRSKQKHRHLVNSLLSTRCLCLAISFIAVGGLYAQSDIVFMTAGFSPVYPFDSRLVSFDSGTQSFMTDTGGARSFGGVTILNIEVLVADAGAGQIQRFDPDGSYVEPFASPGAGATYYLESDSDDNVYTTAGGGYAGFSAIRFNSDGAVTGTFYHPRMAFSRGIDADASGNVYVVGSPFDDWDLLKFASDGTFLNSIPLTLRASDISIDEVNQRLYLAGDGIRIYDISGAVPVLAGAIVTPVNSSINGVHYAAESGNILATDFGTFSGDPRGLEYSPLGTLIAEYRLTNAYLALDIITMVPEPGSMGLVLLTFTGFGLTRSRRRRLI
jgi:probable HAF family extracellular repeat protein